LTSNDFGVTTFLQQRGRFLSYPLKNYPKIKKCVQANV